MLTAEDVHFLQRFGILKAEVHYEDGYLRVAPDRRVAADLSSPAGLSEVTRHCLGDRLHGGILMHGGFFLGPQSFYEALRNMPAAERRKFCMTSVKFVNQLYGDPLLATLQRKDARFLNTAMMVTLTGPACSDGLENGQVVSGVGGQYNFVAMAHELPGARSALMLRSTRKHGKTVTSNILPKYGQTTIPRHLRDLVVTEYGIADLRGKSDKEVIAALLNITDSRFQEDLTTRAKRAGKLPQNYRIPDSFRNNLPERLADEMAAYRKQGVFPTFPLGTDFTPEEIVLGQTLKSLKGKLGAPGKALLTMAKAIDETTVPDGAKPYLQRMQLDQPRTLGEKMAQKLIVSELVAQGHV